MAAQNAGVTDGHNAWDFLIILIVVAALVGVTLLLVLNYPKSPQTTISILGILVPALAGVFGISLGAAAGQVKGKATGRQQARQQLKTSLQDKVSSVTQALEEVRGAPGETEQEAFQGGGPRAASPGDAVLRESVSSLQGFLDGLG